VFSFSRTEKDRSTLPEKFKFFQNFYQNFLLDFLENTEKNQNLKSASARPIRKENHLENFHDPAHVTRKLVSAIAGYVWQETDGAIARFEGLAADFPARTEAVEGLVFSLYGTLARLRDRETVIAAVETDLVQIQRWIDRYPPLLEELPEIDLVAAEVNRVRGRHGAAIENYERARARAQSRGSLYLEALACELAGKFYLNWGKPKIANVYLTDAYRSYLNWGARAKAEDLARRDLPGMSPAAEVSIAANWAEAMQLSQTLSGTLQLDKLLVALMEMAIDKTGANLGISILVEGDRLEIAARCVRLTASNTLRADCNLQSVPIATETACALDVPQSVIDSVRQTQMPLLLTEATLTDPFAADPYFRQRRPKALLCLPTIDRGNMTGMIYLESYDRLDAFSGDRLEILQLLATQAAISLENARLYARIEEYSHTLEQKVAERTQQLQQEADIRSQTETALRDSENRYKTLFDNSALQLWELDLSGMKQYFDCIAASGTASFRRFFQQHPQAIVQCLKRLKVLHVNPATYLAFGAKSEAEFLANLNPIALFAQDFNVLREAIVALAEGRQHFKSEFRYQRRDGKLGYTLLHLNVARGYKDTLGKAIASAIEISDRKQAESALQESESKYRALVDASQDAIWSVDDRGRYTFVNPVVKRIYGYEPQHFIGRSIADLAPPQDRDRLRAEFDRLLADTSFFQQEVIHHTRDGQPIHLLFNGIVRRNAEGHILGATGTASDITDRKQAEIELQRAKEAADAANRAKSEFLASMSHELRTPLNAILGFTQVMNRDTSLSREHQDYLRIISQSGEHLLELINNVLEMSKIESGRIALYETQFDLHHFLGAIEGMLQLKAQNKGLRLIFQAADNLPQYIQTDERKLRQVLINLLSNGIKFTDEGSVTLRISVLRQMADGRWQKGEEVGEEDDPRKTNPQPQTPNPKLQTLRFEVEDTGMGILPEELDTLFLPFAQTAAGRKAQEGTGLGLSISRRLVQLMGSDITVRSTVGRGSCFQFDLTLPEIEETALPIEARWGRAIGVAPGQTSYRILIADDCPESRLLMVKLMESLGLEVREAHNGHEAVVVWETWRPHLIWMDMQMPGMDGYRATQQIKARSRLRDGEGAVKTAIVALTASAFERDRMAILAAGCDDFVSKPFREEIILEKLARHLGVRYCFAQPNASVSHDRSSGSAIPTLETLRKELSHLPHEWILQSYQAAIKGSDRILLGLIDKIPPERRLLATVLKEWVVHFRFDRAIELLEPMASLEERWFGD